MKKNLCSCIGRICVDYISLLDKFPKKNSKIPFIKYAKTIGGQSAITAVTLSRLGLKVNLVSVIGDDEEGRFVLKNLKKESVSTKNIKKIFRYRTPIAFVWTEKSTAKRTIVYQKFSIRNILSKKFLIKIIRDSKIVFVDHQGIKSIIRYAEYFKKFNTKIVFDAERVTEDVLNFLPRVNYLICSEDFIKEYIKKFYLKNLTTALKKLYSLGIEIVCCTLGEKGCVAIFNNKYYVSKSIKIKAIDTTGAGDVFHGGFIFGIIKNWDIKKILNFANYVAGKSCLSLGGTYSIPKIDDIPKTFK
jgi:ribokinase